MDSFKLEGHDFAGRLAEFVEINRPKPVIVDSSIADWANENDMRIFHEGLFDFFRLYLVNRVFPVIIGRLPFEFRYVAFYQRGKIIYSPTFWYQTEYGEEDEISVQEFRPIFLKFEMGDVTVPVPEPVQQHLSLDPSDLSIFEVKLWAFASELVDVMETYAVEYAKKKTNAANEFAGIGEDV